MRRTNLNGLTLLVFVLLSACSKDSEPVQIGESKEVWFNVEAVNDNTWFFQEGYSPQANVSYLLSGSERAIMFDSGTGENGGQDGSKVLYKIKETTDLPVTLLLSHFHFDHNQNVDEFEHVAFPDLDFLRQATDEESVYQFTQNDLLLGEKPTSVKVSEWLPLETDIDLGDRVIELVNLPGHTDESVVIVDHSNKMAFLGDFLYSGALYVFDPQDMEVYLKSMDRLMTILDDQYTLFGAHGNPEVSYRHLRNARDLLDCIVNSDCYNQSSSSVFGIRSTTYSSLDRAVSILLVHSD